MKKQKKIISYRLQSYLSLIPIFGMVTVLFIGMYNICIFKKNRLYLVLYYLILLLPMSLFGGVAILAFMFGISLLENITLQIIFAFLLSCIMSIFIGITIVAIQKGMIEKFEKHDVGKYS